MPEMIKSPHYKQLIAVKSQHKPSLPPPPPSPHWLSMKQNNVQNCTFYKFENFKQNKITPFSQGLILLQVLTTILFKWKYPVGAYKLL